MLLFFSATIFLLVAFVIYCIIHCSTSYDRKDDDEQQEQFVKNNKQS